MNILSELFQKNQQIGQSPMSIVRTPRQEAYDNLLNKQYDIQQENEKYNTYNNLMSGMGGLGKVLASAFVKNPIEKAGAMNGLTEQEYRTDDLRKAYEQARTNQNKDYVQQAKDQLALAIADEDKALANDWKTKEFDYRKAYDDARNTLAEKAFDLNEKVANKNMEKTDKDIEKTDKDIEKIDAEIKALGDKSGIDTDKFSDIQKMFSQAAYEDFKNGKKTLEQFAKDLNSIASGNGFATETASNKGILDGIADSAVNLLDITKDILGKGNKYKDKGIKSITKVGE